MNAVDIELTEGAASEEQSARKEPRRWRGLFPEALGVALVVALVLGVLGVGVSTYTSIDHEADALQASHGDAVARTLARALGTLGAERAGALEATLESLRTDIRLRRITWQSSDGKRVYAWSDDSVDAAARMITFEAPVFGDSGEPSGVLRAEFQPPAATTGVHSLLQACVVALAVSLCLYLALYRELRKRLRPMNAIHRNLQTYVDGLESQLATLQLSTSFGVVAEAWNQLIAQLEELRTSIDSSRGEGAEPLQRFETRALRTLFDRLPLGVMRVSAQQCVEYANAAVGRTMRLTDRAAEGTPLADLVGVEISAALGHGIERGIPTSVDRKPEDDPGGTALRFTLLPPEANGADRAAIVTVEDISHVHEAERARDNFLYHVTHELRTPLTNIQAYAETLAGPEFDDEQIRRECYNVIISETRRLSRLVEDILSVSQMEVGTARMELGEVDLVKLLRQTVQDHLGAADEKQIAFTLKLPPKLPKIRGDKQRLSVLFNNIIGNALKYTPEKGEVHVQVEIDAQHIQVNVRDTGIGIAPEEQAHVFDKFFRATNEEVRDITGTGLGLSIAREVVRLHGGDIRLESAVGEGSTFRIELPAPQDSQGRVA